MSEERSHFAQRIDERQFKLTRRGYDKREVRAYLEDLEQAFRELEGHARRTSQRVGELENDLAKARASEKVSVDNAMLAVFDAKDRILERARHRADEIEEQAHAEAARIKAAAVSGVGSEGGPGAQELAAARAQADEIIASARREAEQIRLGAGTEAAQDLEAELAAASAQLRRAHGDTAAAREELDAARKRIVELESGIGGAPSAELEAKFAQLESHLNAARDEKARLEDELGARDRQVKALEEAVIAAERALDESKDYVARIEADADAMKSEVEMLRADVLRLQEESASRPESSGNDFNLRMRSIEAALAGSDGQAEQIELVNELLRAGTFAADPADQIAELDHVVESEGSLAEAQRMIEDLEAKLAEHGENTTSAADADTLLAAAREEAEAIKADAEEEAEQRAAKVIAKAREEADQVRQTVATLTAQAEDARSAALRAKLEAEDLAEAQRSMSEAREDIVAAAESRAEEIEAEAGRAAASLREEAEKALTAARAEAERVHAESAEKAAAIVAEAEQRAAEIVSSAAESGPSEGDIDSGDELEAMLAEAERDLAISEEMRRRRAELDAREQELIERERALAAKRESEAATLISAREPAPVPSEAPASEPTVSPDIDAIAGEAAVDDDSDPAEMLSALLEAVIPKTTEVPVDEVGDVGESDPTSYGQPVDPAQHPRMAWPTPARGGDADPRSATAEPDEDDGDTPGDEDPDRQSRYRSRSAQLPRLGNQAKSNMSSMANLRKKSRGRD